MNKKCEVCSVEFNASKARVRTCSVKCGGVIRRSADTIDRDCPVCGVGYRASKTRLRHGRETTCSRACSYAYRAELKRKPRTACVCATCGDEFSRIGSKVKAKHGAQFCSRECHFAGRALGIYKPGEYRHTKAGMIAKRKAGAESYASGDSIEWPEIENEVASVLRSAGHTVIQQHIVSDGEHFWPVDLFIPKLLAVIEIDGADHARHCKAGRDAMVDAQCEADGLTVIRVPDGNPSDVRKAVTRALARLSG